MGKRKWICCRKEFAGVAEITEHLESVHGANRPNQTPKTEEEETHDQNQAPTQARRNRPPGPAH